MASPRTCKLAQPKKRHPDPDPGYLVGSRPMTHLTSSRISMLASECKFLSCDAFDQMLLLFCFLLNAFVFTVPRAEHPKYERPRSACWPVSVSARNYVPSQRLLELACPRIRKDVYDGYDPFVVSHAALCTNPSPRTLQLSVPLPRKCTPKASTRRI